MLQKLNRSYVEAHRETLSAHMQMGSCDGLPERILQFGEGNFLRAFVDWMLDGLNAGGDFDAGIVVVQPIAQGRIDALNAQDGYYTVLTRGMVNGEAVVERRLVTSVSRAIDPYVDFEAYSACAANRDLRFVVSNTTEAGIIYSVESLYTDRVQDSFPAKVCAFLYARFCTLHADPDAGLVFLPCELINYNGSRLKEYVLRHAEAWQLGDAFCCWVEEANTFCNTLVDRIVPGFPADEAAGIWEQLGYHDDMLVVGEHFHLWVIEGPDWIEEELPLARAGYNVIVTDDLQRYRTRKVLVLNGAHTSSVLAAYHCGLNTVGEMMHDPLMSAFLKQAVCGEVLPGLDMADEEKQSFADAVMERFRNPFVQHELLSISLNSVSKWPVRVLPSVKAYYERMNALPRGLCFSLAALLYFYTCRTTGDGSFSGSRGDEEYAVRDDPDTLQLFANLCSLPPLEYAERALSESSILGDMQVPVPGLMESVACDLSDIKALGMRGAVEKCLKGVKCGD